jgi:hypothetical protein
MPGYAPADLTVLHALVFTFDKYLGKMWAKKFI